MRKNKLLILLGCSFLLASVTSCGESNTGNPVYTKDFVNALVTKYNLEPKNEAYTYTEKIEGNAVYYDYVLTCKADTGFEYIFNSKLTKTVTDGDISGTITSSIDFLWGRYKSSAFNAYGSFTQGKVVDSVDYQFYGLYFNDDGTVANSCYSITNDGVTSAFSDYKPFSNAWNQTMIQVEHLNTMCKDLVGCYLW